MARPITRDRGPLGERLLTLRLSSGMTQDQLAAKVGVSQGRIGEIESGANRNPHLDTLVALAKALKVSVVELLDAVTGPAKQPHRKSVSGRRQTKLATTS